MQVAEKLCDVHSEDESYPALSRTVSCPAKSSWRCSIDKVCPSGDRDQQSQKCISRVPKLHPRFDKRSSSPFHLAFPRTALPFSRLLPCSPFGQHLKMARSSLPSAVGGGPKNLLLGKFAFQVPVKLTLRHLSRSLAADDIGWRRHSTIAGLARGRETELKSRPSELICGMS